VLKKVRASILRIPKYEVNAMLETLLSSISGRHKPLVIVEMNRIGLSQM